MGRAGVLGDFPATMARDQAIAFSGKQKMDLLWFVVAIVGLTAAIKHLQPNAMGLLQPIDWKTKPWATYVLVVSVSTAASFFATSNAAPVLVSPFVIRILGESALMKIGLAGADDRLFSNGPALPISTDRVWYRISRDQASGNHSLLRCYRRVGFCDRGAGQCNLVAVNQVTMILHSKQE